MDKNLLNRRKIHLHLYFKVKLWTLELLMMGYLVKKPQNKHNLHLYFKVKLWTLELLMMDYLVKKPQNKHNLHRYFKVKLRTLELLMMDYLVKNSRNKHNLLSKQVKLSILVLLQITCLQVKMNLNYLKSLKNNSLRLINLQQLYLVALVIRHKLKLIRQRNNLKKSLVSPMIRKMHKQILPLYKFPPMMKRRMPFWSNPLNS